MRAAVLYGPGDLRIIDIADAPAPMSDEVRMRITRVGLCGSDVSEYDHGPVLTPLHERHPVTGVLGPIVLGHEMLGIVEDAGVLAAKQFRPGDRVVSGAGVWCGNCRWCASGRTNLCARYYTFGLSINGGLTERITLPARTLTRVPGSVADDNAVLAQPLSVALHAVDRSGADGGEVVVVIGAGAIGGFIIAALRDRRCSAVVAVDIDDDRLSSAGMLGATHLINQRTTAPRDVLGPLTAGEGADVVFESTGVSGMVNLAQSLIRRGGRLQLVGLHTRSTPVDLLDLSVREIDLKTSIAHICGRNLPSAVDILTERDLASVIVEAVVPLEQVGAGALSKLARREVSGKFLVDTTVDDPQSAGRLASTGPAGEPI